MLGAKRTLFDRIDHEKFQKHFRYVDEILSGFLPGKVSMTVIVTNFARRNVACFRRGRPLGINQLSTPGKPSVYSFRNGHKFSLKILRLHGTSLKRSTILSVFQCNCVTEVSTLSRFLPRTSFPPTTSNLNLVKYPKRLN